MAPHSSTLAWKIPWMEEPGRLQSMGSLLVGHDWATSLSLSLSCIGEGNGNPLQCSCLENPRDGGAWWAAVSGAPQSRTRLRRLSSSSSRCANMVCTMDLIHVDAVVLTVNTVRKCFNYNTMTNVWLVTWLQWVPFKWIYSMVDFYWEKMRWY